MRIRHHSRSLANLAGVDSRLRLLFLELEKNYPEEGDKFLHPVVTDGLRTHDEQYKLVASGASRTMHSRHLTGHAIDVTMFLGDKPIYTPVLYREMGNQALIIAAEMNLALEWGGMCFGPNFFDGPHLQIKWGFE